MSESIEKYKSLLKAARDLFWKHGFKRVTIEEICHYAKVSKMTFYKYFPNKLELARYVFDKEANNGAREFRAIMHADTTPADKMRKILMMKLEGTNDISREFIMDFYNNPELGLKDHIEQTTTKLWKEIVNEFKLAQQRGIMRQDFKPEILWYMSQRMMEMVNDDNLLKLFSSPQEMIMEMASFFVYGIIPRD